MLIEYHPIFQSVPVETIVHRHQQDYYKALMKSQKGGDCTPFVEFSLFTIVEALKKVFKGKTFALRLLSRIFNL